MTTLKGKKARRLPRAQLADDDLEPGTIAGRPADPLIPDMPLSPGMVGREPYAHGDIGLTQSQWRFVHALIRLRDPMAAYADATGSDPRTDEHARHDLADLLAHPVVRQHVTDLRYAVNAEAASRVVVNEIWVMDRLVALIQTCEAEKEYWTAFKAIEKLGEEFGMWKGKRANGGANGTGDDNGGSTIETLSESADWVAGMLRE